MKTRIAFTIVLATLFAAASPAQEYKPKFEKFTTANGLTVVLHRDTSMALVSLNMAYHAGSALDPEGRTGLANIAGEMLLLGTKKVPREELLRLRNEEHVSISALTTVDWVGIASVFPKDKLETAIMIEADRMDNSGAYFSAERFEGIITNLKKEHERREKQALGTLTQQIFHELYSDGHPYRHSTIGETADADSIVIEDVKGFSDRYHVPANAFLTIGGDFDPTQARKLVEKYFSAIPAGQPVGWTNVPDTFTPIGQGAFVREDRVSFSQVHLVFPTVRAGHPDEAALKLVVKLLNGSENSLLYTNLVKVNPLVHSMDVAQNSNELTGTFWITVTCKVETRLSTIFDQVMRVLDAIAADGASEEELTAARNQSAMEFYTQLETFYGFGGRCDLLNLGNLFGDTPLYSFNLLQDQQQTNSASVRRVAAQYLTAGNQLVVSVVQIGKPEMAVSMK
ncbi:MAG: pitrilysin family protein [Bacteroidota bacterium]|jgi:zinc protease